jgi:hypothetical protein
VVRSNSVASRAGRLSCLVGLIVLALASPLAAATAGGAERAAAGVAWTDRGVHVVGGPVAAGDHLLVLVVNANRSVWLEGIDPATGTVRWKLPEGFSEITGGVAAEPLAHDGIALALVPAGGTTSRYVRLEGVRVATGAVVWRAPIPLLVTDAPQPCPKPLGARAFCVVVADAPGSLPDLVALTTKTGARRATVPGILRQMSTDPGLYQSASTQSALAYVSTPGGVRWQRPVTGLFGAGYDPDYGWNFEGYSAVEVGSVGPQGAGNTFRLFATRTAGISESTGARLWIDHGEFQCGGGDLVHGAFLCLMTGTVTETASGTATVSKGASVTLEGFAPRSGRITWKLRVGGLRRLLLGDVAIQGGHGLVVGTPAGRMLVVDVRTGHASAPSPGETFWCARLNVFEIRPPAGIDPHRVGTSRFTPCDARGRPAAGAGAPSSLAGVTVGHVFAWASPQGLTATRR